MAVEQKVGVAADPGGGPKIRNREVYIQQSDGTYALVEQQVVSHARSDGTLVDATRFADDVAQLTTDGMRAGVHELTLRAFARDGVGQR